MWALLSFVIIVVIIPFVVVAVIGQPTPLLCSFRSRLTQLDAILSKQDANLRLFVRQRAILTSALLSDARHSRRAASAEAGEPFVVQALCLLGGCIPQEGAGREPPSHGISVSVAQVHWVSCRGRVHPLYRTPAGRQL